MYVFSVPLYIYVFSVPLYMVIKNKDKEERIHKYTTVHFPDPVQPLQ
jgi:hypothetical protein